MKKLIFTLPWILISFSLNAQNSDKFTGSILWKVSGNGLECPSYILGTHHLADVSVAQGWPGFQEALDEAVQVAGELLMSDMSGLQSSLMMHAAMPTGTTYQSLLSEEDCKTLEESLHANFGVGLDQIGQMKPGMLNVMYAARIYAKLMPEHNPLTHVSIDQYVQQYGAEKGKKVIGLEEIQDQIHALFYAESLKNQAEALVCVVKNLKNMEQDLITLNRCYAEGDLYGAYASAFDEEENPCKMSDEFALALNKNRNDKWMEKLPGIFADGATFVAVGMLHLCGEEGLLYQLDKMGYTIEAVK